MPLCGGFEIQLGGGISVNIQAEPNLTISIPVVKPKSFPVWIVPFAKIKLGNKVMTTRRTHAQLLWVSIGLSSGLAEHVNGHYKDRFRTHFRNNR